MEDGTSRRDQDVRRKVLGLGWNKEGRVLKRRPTRKDGHSIKWLSRNSSRIYRERDLRTGLDSFRGLGEIGETRGEDIKQPNE